MGRFPCALMDTHNAGGFMPTTELIPRQVEARYPYLSVSHLANMRWEKRGPNYTRTRSGRILYAPEDIEAWLAGKASA